MYLRPSLSVYSDLSSSPLLFSSVKFTLLKPSDEFLILIMTDVQFGSILNLLDLFLIVYCSLKISSSCLFFFKPSKYGCFIGGISVFPMRECWRSLSVVSCFCWFLFMMTCFFVCIVIFVCCSLSLKKYKTNLRSQIKVSSSENLFICSDRILEALAVQNHIKTNSLVEVLDHPADANFGYKYV